MKIALIGSGGQLGTDFLKLQTEHEFISLDRSKLDVSDFDLAKSVLTEIKPDVIINLAALTNLDYCEEHLEEAYKVNAFSQFNLARIAKDLDCKLIYFSTDYVFGLDDNRNQPYIETDNTGPLNVYASSKLAGEDLSRFVLEKLFVIRVAVLFGTAGAAGKGGNFVEKMIQIAKEKGEVSVVSDQIVSPTYTLEIAQNTMELIKTDQFGTYHMTGQGSCSFFEFAQKIFEILNIKVQMNKVSIDDFKTNHKKPRYSALENKALKDLGIDNMSTWEVMLEKYLKEKGHIN